MGECLIIRKGGSLRLPILDERYPADGSSTYAYGVNTTHTFMVNVAIKGMPDVYSYQWYVNDKPISGATGETYTYKTEYAGSVKVFCRVGNAAGFVDSKVATLTVTTNMVYLFNGSDNTALTGGWKQTKDNYASDNGQAIGTGTTLYVYTERSKANTADGLVYLTMNNKIDVSDYTKLYIEWGSCYKYRGTAYHYGNDTRADQCYGIKNFNTPLINDGSHDKDRMWNSIPTSNTTQEISIKDIKELKLCFFVGNDYYAYSYTGDTPIAHIYINVNKIWVQ